MPPYFFNKGEINCKKLVCACSGECGKPWMVNAAYGRSHVFQQDGAPAHKNNLVQNWLSDNVDMFWSKEFWPPKDPDLNPLECYVWSSDEEITNKSRHPNVTTCVQTLHILNNCAL